MAIVENLQEWCARSASNHALAARAEALGPRETLEAINAVELNGRQMRCAIDSIKHILVRTRADEIQHMMLLVEVAEREKLEPMDHATVALRARAIAMDRWCQRHDPFGQTDVEAFFEAGATAQLVETDEGFGFDPDGFLELVTFIAELPC